MTAGENPTAATYERVARDYAKEISPVPPAQRAEALGRLMEALPPRPAILEVGSGTGRDADHLESLGATVRRTDVARAFIEIQAERGRAAELLDLLTDDLGGPYDGIVAMCVLIHVAPARMDAVLRKIAEALRPRGAFLASVREGEGEEAGVCQMTFVSRDDFAARLADAGLSVGWDDRHIDTDGDTWLTFLATRES